MKIIFFSSLNLSDSRMQNAHWKIDQSIVSIISMYQAPLIFEVFYFDVNGTAIIIIT